MPQIRTAQGVPDGERIDSVLVWSALDKSPRAGSQALERGFEERLGDVTLASQAVQHGRGLGPAQRRYQVQTVAH